MALASEAGGIPVDASRRGPLQRVFSFLKSHPIVCLLLLTPGIPEYLSSSSPVDAIVLNPAQFLFQLTANLGLYGPGVLLIREAMIRWNKGWATVLVLGAAYGIVEEGIGLSTLFYSKAGPVGQFGYYGHWLGVNWVWTAIILPVHMIFSISLPILVLGLALPFTKGKSLLSMRKIRAAFGILCVDVAVLFVFVLYGEHFWMGYPVLAGSFVAVVGLVVIARSMPSEPFARTKLPQKRPRTMALLGLVFYPTVLIVSAPAMSLHAPPILDFGVVILVQALFLTYVLRVGGSYGNESQLVAFAFGLIVPIAAIGLIGTIGFPLVLIPDVVMVLFFRMLWRRYRTASPVLILSPTDPSKGLSEI